ncbi:TetR family transcriptional regulator [Prauserella shujinwangii]|uniref:TetR family transcriptional regulator n=1 Tax=Prauserella shujinwangii TaxID=1453103 RepID=A0A2T0M0U3_9PSEU|nr:TetR family transcriptional regulator C-terminal domain-containing protein [Prauserella shujinwangii]PRX50212.1 TetR family transcriptional regulator [Prauserella shujinwangii]
MPKIVNRDERRREIAEALLRVIANAGIEAVSVRSVAAEAGISAGAVQKYFATKEDLLRFAFTLTGEYLLQRWERVEGSGPFLDVLRRHLLEALPLDEQRRAELIVVFAFTARAATLPDWAAQLRDSYDAAQVTTTAFLEAGQDSGDVRTDVPADRLADLVIVLADGFSARMLHTPPGSPAHERLLDTLDLALTDLLAPR